MPDPCDISPFVNAVFARWRTAGVRFLILRNYEGLPHHTTNDIDVLVEPGQLAKAESLLLEAARATDFLRVNRAEFATRACYFAARGSGQPAHFDLFTALRWRGFDFVAADSLLEQRLERDTFAVPHPVHEAAVNLLATFVFSGRVKEKYRAAISATFLNEAAHARKFLSQTCGPQLAAELVAKAAAGEWDGVQQLHSRVRRELIIRQLSHHPLRTAIAVGHDAVRLGRRLFRPPGMLIALIGADGCGKSTVQPLVSEVLAPEFSPVKSAQFHWKPPVFSARRQAARPPTTNPHAKPPRPWPLSFIFLALHWLEFVLGHFFRVRPIIFRGGLVLVDRHYYDFFVDPRRYRLNVPGWMVRAGYALLPKPDLVFLLDAPPDVLQQRKREVPLAETERQCAAYRALIRTLPNGRLLDATLPPVKIAAAVRHHVIEFLALRSLERDPTD